MPARARYLVPAAAKVGLVLATTLLSGCAPSHATPTTVAAPIAVTPPSTSPPTPKAAAPATPTTVVAPVRLRVFEAGSLMIPFAALETAFEAANPDIDVELEAHGSIQVIRHVTDLHEAIDIVASADHALLSQLMYGSINPDTGQPYADWNIRFATNRMVLAYSPDSVGAATLNADNWHEVISRPGTRLGLADPRFDACGYRQLMVLQLAETLYDQPHLFEDLLAGRFVAPITAEASNGSTLIHVPELLEPRPKSTIVLRGSSVQLIPLLQSGDLDYIFEYESVATQHGLAHLVLPPELNLGDPAQAGYYDRVAVRLDFRRFASVEPAFDGEVIAYGLTIPSNAPHPEAAARLVAFLLGPEGRRLMSEQQHPLLDPPTVDFPQRLPALLQPLCAPEPEG